MSRTGFRLLDPVKSLRQLVDFVRQLHDREALLPRERQRRFLGGEGFVAWPGPAVADFIAPVRRPQPDAPGGFVIDDRIVTLADIACPILSVVGEVDEIAPAPPCGRSSAPHRGPRSTSCRCAPATSGSSSGAPRRTPPGRSSRAGRAGAPATASFRSRCAALPTRSRSRTPPGSAPGWGSGSSSPRASEAGRRARSPGPRHARSAAPGCSPRRSPGSSRGWLGWGAWSRELAISLGLLLDEQARRAPDADVLPVRGPRVLARGGQPPGRHRGPRPDLARDPPGRARRRADEHPPERVSPVVAALNRLGAVAVLMRPDGDRRPRGRARAGARGSSPTRSWPAGPREAQPDGAEVMVLGGGGEDRATSAPA